MKWNGDKLKVNDQAVVDSHARLRFPRAEGEPPCHLRFSGVSPIPLFPQESPSRMRING